MPVQRRAPRRRKTARKRAALKKKEQKRRTRAVVESPENRVQWGLVTTAADAVPSA
jgi:hypothetical protein